MDVTFGSGLFVWWLGSALISIGLLVLVVWVIALIVRSVFRDDRYRTGSMPQPPMADPLAILRERFARGEITAEEYEQARRTLGL